MGVFNMVKQFSNMIKGIEFEANASLLGDVTFLGLNPTKYILDILINTRGSKLSTTERRDVNKLVSYLKECKKYLKFLLSKNKESTSGIKTIVSKVKSLFHKGNEFSRDRYKERKLALDDSYTTFVDEATKYNAAYANTFTMGISPQKLIDGIDAWPKKKEEVTEQSLIRIKDFFEGESNLPKFYKIESHFEAEYHNKYEEISKKFNENQKLIASINGLASAFIAKQKGLDESFKRKKKELKKKEKDKSPKKELDKKYEGIKKQCEQCEKTIYELQKKYAALSKLSCEETIRYIENKDREISKLEELISQVNTAFVGDKKLNIDENTITFIKESSLKWPNTGLLKRVMGKVSNKIGKKHLSTQSIMKQLSGYTSKAWSHLIKILQTTYTRWKEKRRKASTEVSDYLRKVCQKYDTLTRSITEVQANIFPTFILAATEMHDQIPNINEFIPQINESFDVITSKKNQIVDAIQKVVSLVSGLTSKLINSLNTDYVNLIENKEKEKLEILEANTSEMQKIRNEISQTNTEIQTNNEIYKCAEFLTEYLKSGNTKKYNLAWGPIIQKNFTPPEADNATFGWPSIQQIKNEHDKCTVTNFENDNLKNWQSLEEEFKKDIETIDEKTKKTCINISELRSTSKIIASKYKTRIAKFFANDESSKTELLIPIVDGRQKIEELKGMIAKNQNRDKTVMEQKNQKYKAKRVSECKTIIRKYVNILEKIKQIYKGSEDNLKKKGTAADAVGGIFKSLGKLNYKNFTCLIAFFAVKTQMAIAGGLKKQTGGKNIFFYIDNETQKIKISKAVETGKKQDLACPQTIEGTQDSIIASTLNKAKNLFKHHK
ncbi:MAG: hypothetical protein NkDv07_0002 [Candidatus Improbicoccus devescovinae]|nr:MAG: hypothetical protein NkDv07_0002 [Candidatus Improbicoccus devescovinae]